MVASLAVLGASSPSAPVPKPVHFIESQYLFAPHNKLLFCWIQKVGCTRFMSLFPVTRFYASVARKGERYHDALDRVKRDPSWTKAVFLREPLSRFLSGYLNKCKEGDATQHYCRTVFGSDNATFSSAVGTLAGMNRHEIDGHFRQQCDHCGGLCSGELAFYSTIELLEPETSRERVGEMLDRVEALAQWKPKFDALFPEGGRLYSDHSTNAHSKLEAAFENPAHVASVVDFFFEDYTRLGIALPPFAEAALVGLRDTRSPHALEPSRLALLINVTRAATAAGSRGLVGTNTRWPVGDYHR